MGTASSHFCLPYSMPFSNSFPSRSSWGELGSLLPWPPAPPTTLLPQGPVVLPAVVGRPASSRVGASLRSRASLCSTPPISCKSWLHPHVFALLLGSLSSATRRPPSPPLLSALYAIPLPLVILPLLAVPPPIFHKLSPASSSLAALVAVVACPSPPPPLPLLLNLKEGFPLHLPLILCRYAFFMKNRRLTLLPVTNSMSHFHLPFASIRVSPFSSLGPSSVPLMFILLLF